MIQEGLAGRQLERRGLEGGGAVVEPLRCEPVLRGDLLDGSGEFVVEVQDGVDIVGGVAQTVPGEERAADDHNDVPRGSRRQRIGDLDDEGDDLLSTQWLIGHRRSPDLAKGFADRSRGHGQAVGEVRGHAVLRAAAVFPAAPSPA